MSAQIPFNLATDIEEHLEDRARIRLCDYLTQKETFVFNGMVNSIHPDPFYIARQSLEMMSIKHQKQKCIKTIS